MASIRKPSATRTGMIAKTSISQGLPILSTSPFMLKCTGTELGNTKNDTNIATKLRIVAERTMY